MRPLKATDHDGQPLTDEVVLQVRDEGNDKSRLQARLSTGANHTVRIAWWVARAKRNDYVPFYSTPHLTADEFEEVVQAARKLYVGMAQAAARERVEACDG